MSSANLSRNESEGRAGLLDCMERGEENPGFVQQDRIYGPPPSYAPPPYTPRADSQTNGQQPGDDEEPAPTTDGQSPVRRGIILVSVRAVWRKTDDSWCKIIAWFVLLLLCFLLMALSKSTGSVKSNIEISSMSPYTFDDSALSRMDEDMKLFNSLGTFNDPKSSKLEDTHFSKGKSFDDPFSFGPRDRDVSENSGTTDSDRDESDSPGTYSPFDKALLDRMFEDSFQHKPFATNADDEE